MKNNKIDYIEFKTTDLEKTKVFYTSIFWWKFQDFWDKYISFSNSGLRWWFELSDSVSSWWVLVVLHHDNLGKIKKEIIEAGWKIVVDIFSFPGWERFEFNDNVWNYLAVWTQK